VCLVAATLERILSRPPEYDSLLYPTLALEVNLLYHSRPQLLRMPYHRQWPRLGQVALKQLKIRLVLVQCFEPYWAHTGPSVFYSTERS
jgi:hypothetical protein